MILTVEELKKYITTDEDDDVLEAKLQAIELLIRGYTSNSFHVHGFGRLTDIVGGIFTLDETAPYEAGDTVEVSGSVMNDGLFTVKEASGDTFTVNEKTYDEIDAYVCKVVYPMDVKMGVVNMMKWDLNNRDKAGVASETISRHSVTYRDETETNFTNGYPTSLMGFLKPYKKARFGRGIRA